MSICPSVTRLYLPCVTCVHVYDSAIAAYIYLYSIVGWRKASVKLHQLTRLECWLNLVVKIEFEVPSQIFFSHEDSLKDTHKTHIFVNRCHIDLIVKMLQSKGFLSW